MNAAGGSGGSHGVIQRLSPWHRRRRAPAAGRSSTRRRWSPRGTPSGSATCARRGRASRAALQPRQSSCSAGMDALRTATMAHGSTETNAMRADCIAAGSSGLARAQAMLTGETYSCSQRNDRKASVARRSASLPASIVKNRKELITDHLGRKHRSGPPLHGRIALEAPTAEPPGLQAQACTMLCAHFAGARGRRGPKPRPDVQHTPRGAAHAERSACASRGQTAAARCRPVGPARPRGGGGGRACLARARPGEEHLVRGAA